MNWVEMDSMLSQCAKQPGIAKIPEEIDVGDYGEVLARYNGVEGFVAPEQYVMFWAVDQIRALNAAYRVAEYARGIVLLGTDGADTGFGRDETTGKYGTIPLVGMSRDRFREMGDSFEAFLRRLARG